MRYAVACRASAGFLNTSRNRKYPQKFEKMSGIFSYGCLPELWEGGSNHPVLLDTHLRKICRRLSQKHQEVGGYEICGSGPDDQSAY